MNKLVLTGLLAAGTMTHLQGAQPAGQRPNILFILVTTTPPKPGASMAEYWQNMPTTPTSAGWQTKE